MNAGWHVFLFAPALLAVILLARTLPARFAGEMPQVPGEDVLQLVLGDARRELSKGMLEMADDYFHGGMTHEGCTGLEGDHDHTDHTPDEAHGVEAGIHGVDMPAGAVRTGFPDPWHWINRHVHAQHHRHLSASEYDELLPWIWAACRSAPDNIQAWLIGSYVLTRKTGDATGGIRLLKQGVAANPASPELAFALGELYLNKLQQSTAAEPWFEKARATGLQGKRRDDLDARILQIRTLLYLGVLAKRRNDLQRLRTLLNEAASIHPDHQLTQALRRLLPSEDL
jgi:hypothetical protein